MHLSLVPKARALEPFASRDLDETRDHVGRVLCPHSLELQRGQDRLACEMSTFQLRSMSVCLLSYGADITVDPGEITDFYSLAVILAGASEVWSSGQALVAGPGMTTLMSPADRVRMRWSAECAKAIIRIDKAAVESVLGSLLERPLVRSLSFDLGCDGQRPEMRAWWRSLRFFIDEIQAPDTLLTSRHSVQSHEQWLITNLLLTHPNSYSEELRRGGPGIAPRHVKRVEDFIVANCQHNISLEDLVVASGVSARTLHRSFKTYRGTSPMNFLKAIRLEHVRAALQAADADASVTRIAGEWGFTQLGRFAVEYRERFGEPPSKTLRH